MFCRHCGNQVPEESAFCQHCGNQLGASQQAAACQPKAWERMTVTINFRRGEAGWVAEEAYTAPVAQQYFWNDAQPLIQDIETMLVDEGWQPLGHHGPACVELDKFKSAEGRNPVALALGAVASYGANLLFARYWKFTAKSITLRWRRPTMEDAVAEQQVHIWLNTQTGEWEPWQLDTARNQWVLLDEEDSTEPAETESIPAQSSPVQSLPDLTEAEARLVRLLAEKCSCGRMMKKLGMNVLELREMGLRLREKFGVRSEAEMIQRARQMGLVAPGTQG